MIVTCALAANCWPIFRRSALASSIAGCTLVPANRIGTLVVAAVSTFIPRPWSTSTPCSSKICTSKLSLGAATDGLALAEGDVDELGESDVLGLSDGDALALELTDGDVDADGDRDGDDEADALTLGLVELEGDTLAVCDGDRDTDDDGERDALADDDGLTEGDAELLGEASAPGSTTRRIRRPLNFLLMKTSGIEPLTLSPTHESTRRRTLPRPSVVSVTEPAMRYLGSSLKTSG